MVPSALLEIQQVDPWGWLLSHKNISDQLLAKESSL